MRLLWLPDVLRRAGLEVVESPGWEDRGRDMRRVDGIVWHHTVTGPSVADARVAALLRDGHSTLPGPLSQLGLRRDGTFDLIAAGRCNHNGYGEWGNDSIGIEAYNAGDGRDPWPDAQLDAYDRGTAALCAHLGLGTDRVKGHRETDPRRKIDPAGIDMDQARQRVAALLTYRPPTPNGWLMALTDAEQTELLSKVRDLHEQWIGKQTDAKDETLRQLVKETHQRTGDLVTGKRPAKG